MFDRAEVRRFPLLLAAILLSACATPSVDDSTLVRETIPLWTKPTGPDQLLATLDVEIDGVEREFLLDTGAVRTSLLNDPVAAKYPSVGEHPGQGVAGRVTACALIQPERLRFGHQVFPDPTIARCNQSLFGLDFLGRQAFQVDLFGRELKILSGLPDGVVTEPIRVLEAGHYALSVKFGENSASAVFDTGASVTVIDADFVRKHPESFSLVRDEPGFDALGNKIESKIYNCSSFQVGKLHMENVEVAATEFGPSFQKGMQGAVAILGNNIIVHGVWSFEGSTSRWFVEPR